MSLFSAVKNIVKGTTLKNNFNVNFWLFKNRIYRIVAKIELIIIRPIAK